MKFTPIIKNIWGIIFAFAVIMISEFFAGRVLYPYFRKNDLIFYNNTHSIIQLCERRENESRCSDMSPHSNEKISVKNVELLTVNKVYFFKIDREILSKLQRSEIYCERKERCLYALQLEGNNLIYGLGPGQIFPVTKFSKQPDGFPLEVHAFADNNSK